MAAHVSRPSTIHDAAPPAQATMPMTNTITTGTDPPPRASLLVSSPTLESLRFVLILPANLASRTAHSRKSLEWDNVGRRRDVHWTSRSGGSASPSLTWPK